MSQASQDTEQLYENERPALTQIGQDTEQHYENVVNSCGTMATPVYEDLDGTQVKQQTGVYQTLTSIV